MKSLLDTTLEFSKRHSLVTPGERVLLGFSGGADSVALTLVLLELAQSGKLPLQLHLAHLNHRLRGDDANADETFCRQFAKRRGMPIEVETRDVGATADADGLSLEEAARRERYDFLLQTARQVGAEKIATAHHADDVAESVLLRIIRGCGVRGLGAMPPKRPAAAGSEVQLVRPFLRCTREQILDFLREREQDFCRDESNEDTGFLRNRLRHELIPLLREEYDGFSASSLEALNHSACELTSLVDKLVEEQWTDLCCEVTGAHVCFDAEVFQDLHPAVRKAAIRRAAARLTDRPLPGLTFEHYERAASLADESVGAAVSLPGNLHARREHGTILFSLGFDGPAIPPRQLPLNGEVRVPEAGLTIECELIEKPEMAPKDARERSGPHEIYLAADKVELPLTVRGRRPGDRFTPLGAPGSTKLKDFFIDHKVPRHRRDLHPLVISADGRITWVVGRTINEAFRLRGSERRVLKVTARENG